MATAISVIKTLLNQVRSELGMKVKLLSVKTEERNNRRFHGWFHYCTVKLYGAKNEIISFNLKEAYHPFDGSSDFKAEFCSAQIVGEIHLEGTPEIDRCQVDFRGDADNCPLPGEVEPIEELMDDENSDGERFSEIYLSSEPPTGWQYSEEFSYLLLYNQKWEVHFPLKSRELLET